MASLEKAPLQVRIDQLSYTAKRFKLLTEHQQTLEVNADNKLQYAIFDKVPKVQIQTEIALNDLKKKLEEEKNQLKLEKEKEARRKAEKPSKQQLFNQFLYDAQNLDKLSNQIFQLVDQPI